MDHKMFNRNCTKKRRYTEPQNTFVQMLSSFRPRSQGNLGYCEYFESKIFGIQRGLSGKSKEKQIHDFISCTLFTLILFVRGFHCKRYFETSKFCFNLLRWNCTSRALTSRIFGPK